MEGGIDIIANEKEVGGEHWQAALMVGGGVGGSIPNDIASRGKWVAFFFTTRGTKLVNFTKPIYYKLLNIATGELQ